MPNTMTELAVRSETGDLINQLTERNPILATVPFRAANKGIQNVAKKLESVTGAQVVDMDQIIVWRVSKQGPKKAGTNRAIAQQDQRLAEARAAAPVVAVPIVQDPVGPCPTLKGPESMDQYAVQVLNPWQFTAPGSIVA